tara:strand:+ start:1708 stop:1821 length:114 start_codon:yes stop_codon:yes gene_type:complete
MITEENIPHLNKFNMNNLFDCQAELLFFHDKEFFEGL